MKKILLGMMAASMMFATSCQNEEFADADKLSTVSFNVGTPEIASRAYSDGTTATHLQYAVYDADGKELTDLTVTDATINGSTTVNLQLTTGNTYSVIFWAAAPNAPYTVDLANKSMTVDYTGALSNDENRDAFYAKKEFTVTGAQTETIELKRPFAQLNIGVGDYVASTKAGYTPTKSAVTVKNIYNKLNLWNGTVDGSQEVTYDYAAIPTNETFPVAGYEYLSMNYLLVATEKALVEVEFGYTETDATAAKTRTVGSVPVQRNYRTNIYGNLLTSDVDINVTIKPDYEKPDYELDDLHKAALNGGEITLTEDITLTAPLEIKSNLTLNLNGKTISGDYHKSVGAIIKNYGTLTINGGTISSTGDNGGSAVQNNGTMTINEATLNGAPNANGSWPSYTVNNTGNLTINNSTITSKHGAVASYGDNAVVILNNSTIDMAGIPGFTSHGIYTYNNGKVIVNGGTYENKATDQAASGASVINGAVEVTAGNFSGRIENYYGTPVLKGGTYSVKPNNKFIASGYKAIEKDGRYYVVADNVDAVVSDATELEAALAAGGEVVLADDVTYTSNKIENDAVINLNGNTFTPSTAINLYNNADLTMVGGNYEVNVGSGYVDVRPSSADGSVVVYENVHFKSNYINNTYGTSTDRLNSVVEVCAAATDAKTVVKFKNCTFDNGKVLIEGMSGKTGIVEAVFEGCTFNALTNSSPIDVMNYVTATIKVKDCTFNLECTSGVASAIDVSPSSSTSVVLTATNNTFNAVAATPYTYDASKGETEAHNVKVHGTPANIKFISAYDNTTVTETGTKKSGIAKL